MREAREGSWGWVVRIKFTHVCEVERRRAQGGVGEMAEEIGGINAH